MDLSIIIVNWNSADFVRTCLNTLYRNDIGVTSEIIVIDNASFDACQRIISDEFPGVKFIQSHQNLGFAKANNLGAVQAHSDFLLFLNPDTEILGNAVSDMLSAIRMLPKAGVLGCKLLNTDMSLQTSCVQPFPTILNQAFDADILHRMFPGLSIWGPVPHLLNQPGPAQVQVISGACMMIKRELFAEIGGFSTDYFMYTEDIDLCYKVKSAGYINYYTGSCSVIHHGGGSSHKRKENSFANVQIRESIFKFLKKTHGEIYAVLYKISMFLAALIRFCIIALAFIPCMLMGRRSSCGASLTKWMNILRWSLGITKWAR